MVGGAGRAVVARAGCSPCGAVALRAIKRPQRRLSPRALNPPSPPLPSRPRAASTRARSGNGPALTTERDPGRPFAGSAAAGVLFGPLLDGALAAAGLDGADVFLFDQGGPDDAGAAAG